MANEDKAIGTGYGRGAREGAAYIYAIGASRKYNSGRFDSAFPPLLKERRRLRQATDRRTSAKTPNNAVHAKHSKLDGHQEAALCQRQGRTPTGVSQQPRHEISLRLSTVCRMSSPLANHHPHLVVPNPVKLYAGFFHSVGHLAGARQSNHGPMGDRSISTS